MGPGPQAATPPRTRTKAGAGDKPPRLGAHALQLANVDAEVRLDDVLAAVAEAIGADAAVVVRPKPGARGDASAIEVMAETPEASPSLEVRSAWVTKLAPLVQSLVGAGDLSSVVSLRHPGALYGQSAAGYAVAMPVGDGESRASAAFFAEGWDRAKAQAARETLDLCGVVLALAWGRVHGADERRANKLLSVALSVLSAVGAQQHFRSASMTLCNEVAVRWRASRVTLGFKRGRYVHAVAMSRTEQLDRKMKLVQAVEGAMEECLDQDLEVIYPPLAARSLHETEAGAGGVATAAKRLANEFGPHHVVSLPLRSAPRGDAAGEPEAVLTVEVEPVDGLPGSAALTADAVEALRLTCNLVAPLLLKLQESDRWVGAKLAREARRTAAWCVGPRNTWAKVLAIVGSASLVAVCVIDGPHRVTGSFLVQAQERQVVAAPFDGYLKDVRVEPGEQILAGETVLAELETSELRLQLSQKLADQAHFTKQADLARRESKTAEVQIAQAEAQRVAAEIDLLQYQIDKATLRSPLGGVVLEGDRKRREGGAVSKGEALFEVAPLDGLRAELRIPESRIAEVLPGQRGELATAAHPNDYLPFTVEKIEPMAEVLDGQNVFRAWVRLESPGAVNWLRPGMEGVAKVRVGEATLVWLWTHEAVEWVRMKLWL